MTKWLATGVRWLLALAVMALVVRAFAHNWGRLDWNQVRPSYGVLLMALLVDMASRAALGKVCHSLFLRFHARLPVVDVLSVIWVATLGKYVPGKVATLGGTMWLFSRYGVRAELAALVPTLATGMLIIVALLFSVPVLFSPILQKSVGHPALIATLVVVGGLVALHPKVFHYGMDWATRLLKRPPIGERLAAADLAPALGWTAVCCLLTGASAWLACRAFVPVAVDTIPYVMESALLGGVAGILAVFCPAGLGVREGVFLLLLSPVTGSEMASLIVVYLRVQQTVADLVLAAVGVFTVRTRTSGPGSGRG